MFERSPMVSEQDIGMSQYLHNLVVQRLCLLIRRQIGLERRGVDTLVLCELCDKLVGLVLGGWRRVVDCDGAAVLGKQPSGRQAYSTSGVGRSVYSFCIGTTSTCVQPVISASLPRRAGGEDMICVYIQDDADGGGQS